MQRQQVTVARNSKCPQQLIFEFMASQRRVQIWLADLKWTRIEGVIGGFDENFNIVLKEAVEISVKYATAEPTYLGTTLVLFQSIDVVQATAVTDGAK